MQEVGYCSSREQEKDVEEKIPDISKEQSSLSREEVDKSLRQHFQEETREKQGASAEMKHDF